MMVNKEDRDGASWGIGHMGDGHMGNGTHGQRGIMVNTEDRDGAPWGMGHMDSGHMMNMCWIKCNFLNTAWIFTRILL